MIYQTFCALVAQFAVDRGLPVIYMGSPSNTKPPNTGIWLEVRLFRNGNIEYGMADDGPAPAQGFFRVMVCDRPGQSIVAAAGVAESLIAAIPKGTALGPAFVYQKPGLSGPTEDDDRVIHPITWRYTTT